MYLQSAGVYALATEATGFDGVVGSVSVTQFELISGGELDNMSGLTPGQVLYLSTTPGVLSTAGGTAVLKALSATVAVVLSRSVGAGSPVLPYNFSAIPTATTVPISLSDGTLDSGWIPDLSSLYLTYAWATAHQADMQAHPYYVRNPEGGGILDIDEGSLVFDVDSRTQVLDDSVPP